METKETKKHRRISDEFRDELKFGKLKTLLDCVLEDDSLCLELRGNAVNIYYRGGSLFKINDKNDKYNITFDTRYDKDKKLNPNPDIEEAVKSIPFYKQAMDKWFHKHPKYEREFQQIILRENNNSGKISRATDYYIVDIEYQDNENSSRFDMVAFKWPSNGAARKNTNAFSLAFIEVKYGDNAVGGSAGIKKHLDDLKSFIDDKEKLKEFKEDMEQVFKQKCKLGLIDGLSENLTNQLNDKSNQKQVNIRLSDDEPEVIFIFVNHDPESKKINNILSDINISDYPFKILAAQSSFMGYGLYMDNMIEIKDFINMLSK